MAEKNERPIKVVAENRKARFNYAIEDTIETGIALTGTEVKSIRNGKTTIAESYADTKDGEIWLADAVATLIKEEPVFAYRFEGQRYDAGNKLDFLRATIDLALARPDLGPGLRRYLDGIV